MAVADCEDLSGGVGAIAVGLLLIWLWRRDRYAIRLAQRLPITPVAQVQEGMVQIVGTAVSATTEKSSMLGLNCLVTKTKIEEYRDQQSDKEWVVEWEEQKAVPFFVEDHTGRIYVDPAKAEFQLQPDVEITTGEKWNPSARQRSALSGLKWTPSGLEARLRDLYLDILKRRRMLTALPDWMTQAALAGHKKLSNALEDPGIHQQALASGFNSAMPEDEFRRLNTQYENLFELVKQVRKEEVRATESNILPGDPVYIIGPALNSPAGGPWEQPIVIRKEHPSDTFLIAEGSPAQAHENIRKESRMFVWVGSILVVVGIWMTWSCL